MEFLNEIDRRRTFGIISHPDAGKTTLTEKLLLFGGAIQEAGAVKSNKVKKAATSDFMEIERQRGISVTTSVLAFNYCNKKINILDTPGHKDFAEDTYRTLSAVDSVIVVIDVAKGVEEQTKKLVEVCRMRSIPIIVFINKLDREGKDAFDLIDEIEIKLKLNITPLTFPIGMGYEFKGIFNIWKNKVELISDKKTNDKLDKIIYNSIENEQLKNYIGIDLIGKLKDEIELITEVYPKFKIKDYLSGKLQPVFFGSALKNLGVQDLLDCFIDIAPKPRSKECDTRLVKPEEKSFSGFVFKIHANMDPKHRDRVAFVKIVSGVFKKNTPYLHVRKNKMYKFSSPNTFFAEKKEIINTSYPGDIVGLHDTGNFKIGDTLTEGEKIKFKGIPSFSPEHFRYINNKDPMKTKQLEKGIIQLMDEGVAQLFFLNLNNRKIIGAVGLLQFEVIQYRLLNEYGAKCDFENINVYKACWVDIEKADQIEIDEFKKIKQKFLANDKNGKLVYLADSYFSLEMTKEKYSSIKFYNSSEY
ncbi:MAG: peptide chain release factor 3 [Flavobacteriaceae bacterium]|nr:peptide chain release factor 3 [Flavobacteriaceae bacterium]